MIVALGAADIAKDKNLGIVPAFSAEQRKPNTVTPGQ
jgi:hypothetical protein